MVQRRDGPRLAMKALAELVPAGLDSDSAAEPRVYGAVDLAHAAASEHGLDSVGTELGSCGDLRHDGAVRRRRARNGTVEERVSTLGQQGLDFAAHLRVSSDQKGFASAWRALARGVEQVFDLLEAVG